jgi:DNA (cytosine-5)-methyltransferase 1
MVTVSLFAGPGGWCHGARTIGVDPIGIELEPTACATRRAAGHTTIRADLLDRPGNEGYTIPARAVTGLIGSPPCPLFSAAGTGEGVDLLPRIITQFARWGPWVFYDDRTEWPPDVLLLNVPTQWIDLHLPDWVALEQVPPVLPYWETVARWMRDDHGYSTWTGILNAADYGVPQTRKRAFLLASLDRTAGPPEPTHAQHPQGTLFGVERKPWVTMAEALDLDGVLHTNVGPLVDGTRQTRSTSEPAPTITGKSHGQWKLNSNERPRHTDTSRPTPTLTGASRNWMAERPATTIQGDLRVWPPGHKINADDIARLGTDEAERRYGDRAGTDAIRIEPSQLGVLQSFPPDYPWQGTKTSQAQQIGNAVPPTLAAAILERLTGEPT